MSLDGRLRRVDDALWMVETPLRFLGMPLGRRMVVVHITGDDLLLHSPAPLTDALRKDLDTLGSVRWIVPASSLHGHRFMEQYQAAYPAAELFAAPGLRARRSDLVFAADLGDQPDARWAEELDQALFRGVPLGDEVVFLHRRSRSLLVGDLVWNVTPAMHPVPRLWCGWRTRVTPTPAYRRAVRDRDAARRSLERILEWDFDRIMIGHGRLVESGGREALARAWRMRFVPEMPIPR